MCIFTKAQNPVLILIHTRKGPSCTMANAHFSRMFMQAASCRHSNALRPIPTIFSRQILSGGAAGFHTNAKVGEVSEAQNLSEEARLTPPATKKRRRTKAHEESAVEVDAEPRKPQPRRTQVPFDKGEPNGVDVKRKLKSAPRRSVLPAKASGIVAAVELPPVESWHQFFPVRKERTKHSRAIIREVHTADMLAEAFVPEGSKDMTVIEVSAGIFFFFLSFKWLVETFS